MGFVHLHVHSYFSFYDGTAGVEQIIGKAKALHMPAVALTDYNGVYGAVRFIKSAEAAGIKPVVGSEVVVDGIGKLVLLARSASGYVNLCKVLSDTMMRNPLNPVVSLESLSANSGELFALLGAALGDLLKNGQKKKAFRLADKCLGIFGKDGLIIELQDHGLPGDQEQLECLWHFAHSQGLLPVATNNVHFLEAGDYSVHDALIAAARTVHHRHVRPRGNGEFYLKSADEMSTLFIGYEEALENTVLIAKECKFDLPREVNTSLEIRKPGEVPACDYLRSFCSRKLNTVFEKNRRRAARQLDLELWVIEQKGFSDYFLVVADIVRFAASRGIRHSCRGSAPGSLVAYLLDISGVNPIENGLLFERFLNPERVDMPDIDIDFDSKRRDEVIDYAMKKHGGHAAMVATISRFRGRSAIREIGRAKGLSYKRLSELTRSFSYYTPASKIREALATLPELRDSELASDEYSELLDICSHIDGFPRYMSVHLGGVVITKRPIYNWSAVQTSHKGWPLLSFDKDDVETLGLIKTDLLGLRMLSAIEEAVTLIKKQGKSIELDNIDTFDKGVYRLLRSKNTLGCFQVESPGMRSLLGQLHPERFTDVVCAISLFRPGPVRADVVSPFIARRHGRERYGYPHKALKPILDETYGVVLFQEQVLRIAHEIAGFSMGRADLMRRAMKNPGADEMVSFEKEFLAGAGKKGISRNVALEIFDQLSTLAAFGFNKAHACSFARIVFQSVYLKAYYPAEFMTGVLNNLPGMYPERVLLHEARRFGVTILKPDINKSGADYTLEDGAIRIGLRGVRNMGPASLTRILEERTNSCFMDMEDFHGRVKIKENLLRSMILAGVFDSLSRSRKSLLSFLSNEEKITEEIEDFTVREKVAYELEHTGLDLSAHVISLFSDRLDQLGITRSHDLGKCNDGERVTAAGVKVVLHTPPTRSGIRVVFLTLEDETGVSDITVFPDAQEQYAAVLFTADALIVEGRVRRVADSVSITAERLTNLKDILLDFL